MIEKDSKINNAVDVGDIIIGALKEEIKNPRLIGEIRDSEEIDSVMKAMEHNNGHNVVTTIMCDNPSEAIVNLIKRCGSNDAIHSNFPKITGAGVLTSKLNEKELK